MYLYNILWYNIYVLKDMNTQLQKLFEKSNLDNKDKYEISQIFELLPPDKKQNIINNFEVLAFRLTIIHKDIELERKILISDIFTNVRDFYNKYR